MIQILLVISGVLNGIYKIYEIVEKYLVKTPFEKVKEAIGKTDKALDKAKKSGDTSAIEDILNK